VKTFFETPLPENRARLHFLYIRSYWLPVQLAVLMTKSEFQTDES